MGNFFSSNDNKAGGASFNIIPDTSSPDYWRQKGDELARARNQAFAASKAAYEAGDHARAGELSRQGKAYAAESKQAHARAAALFLQRNNPGGTGDAPGESPPGQIDLHGLRVDEAVAVVERALARGRAAGQSRLVLVVGRGLHSAGGQARLRPAIEQLVRRCHVRVTPGMPNEGCVTVDFVSEEQAGWRGCVIC